MHQNGKTTKQPLIKPSKNFIFAILSTTPADHNLALAT
jgi:hypothetical protein